MSTRKFQRNKEDFTCEHCQTWVKGNGYTNHCPKCLWSKHVDVHPGDRNAICCSLMKPIGLVIQKSEPIITHECIRCGHVKRNKASLEDDKDAIIHLSVRG